MVDNMREGNIREIKSHGDCSTKKLINSDPSMEKKYLNEHTM